MKTKLIIITLLTLLFAPFTQAGEVPEKIIAVTMHQGMSVLQFYNHNQNYRTVYAPEAFKNKVCANNPQVFKKCTETEFRHIRAEKVLYFPALPEAKNGQTIKQVYKTNGVYHVLFGSFTNFQQEVCKNNPEKITKCTKTVLKNLKTNGDLKITSRPETYIIPGEKSDSIVIGEKTFTRTVNGYYRISNVKQVTKEEKITAKEAETKSVLLVKEQNTINKTKQETLNKAEKSPHQTNPITTQGKNQKNRTTTTEVNNTQQ